MTTTNNIQYNVQHAAADGKQTNAMHCMVYRWPTATPRSVIIQLTWEWDTVQGCPAGHVALELRAEAIACPAGLQAVLDLQDYSTSHGIRVLTDSQSLTVTSPEVPLVSKTPRLVPFEPLAIFLTLHRMTRLCHLSPLQRRWRDGGASGLPVPSTRPGLEGDMAWPVRNGGSAAHWPFSVAGSLPTPYRTPGLCHVSPLQWHWRDGGASGLPVPSTWPGSEGDVARPRSVNWSMELPAEDQNGDQPSNWEWGRQREWVQ